MLPPMADHPEDALDTKDLVSALRFCHMMEMQTKLRLTDLAASFYALAETLTVQGLLPLDLYEQRRQATLGREEQRAQSEALVTLNNDRDKYALTALPQIDCEARLPLCKARCCTFTFALSAQDLDEGAVRWEYSRPYQIRRRKEDGYCVHNRAGTCQCMIYSQRPSICRTYDCREDKRVWVDFENRIPAP